MKAYSIVCRSPADCESLIGRLAQLSQAAFSEPPWKMRGCHEKMIRQFLAFPSAAVWLGIENSSQECVGFSVGSELSRETIEFCGFPAEAEAHEGDYHLTWRAVEPRFQGNGLGRELTEVRVAEAVRLGYRRVTVSTLHSNLGTLRMYEAIGFRECGRKLFVDVGRLSEHIFFVKSL